MSYPQGPYQGQSGAPGYCPGQGYPPAVGYGVPAYQAPAITTTVLITLFFGLFGLIPASMHSSQARSMGYPTNKYWKAFWLTLVIEIAVWLVIVIGLVAAASSSISSY